MGRLGITIVFMFGCSATVFGSSSPGGGYRSGLTRSQQSVPCLSSRAEIPLVVDCGSFLVAHHSAHRAVPLKVVESCSLPRSSVARLDDDCLGLDFPLESTRQRRRQHLSGFVVNP